jgi:hypothetical protein
VVARVRAILRRVGGGRGNQAGRLLRLQRVGSGAPGTPERARPDGVHQPVPAVRRPR